MYLLERTFAIRSVVSTCSNLASIASWLYSAVNMTCFRASTRSLCKEFNGTLPNRCDQCGGHCDLIRHVSACLKILYWYCFTFASLRFLILSSILYMTRLMHNISMTNFILGHCKSLPQSPMISTSLSCSLAISRCLDSMEYCIIVALCITCCSA